MEQTNNEETNNEILDSDLVNALDLDAVNSTPPASPADLVILEEMAKKGVLYGRKRAKTNPKMRNYIFTTRNRVEIFDAPQTLALLDGAIDFIKQIIQKKGMILAVGTQPAARELIKNFALKFGFPYVAERWLGGILTNFKTIARRIDYFKNLKTDRTVGKFEKYTKKERLEIDREINRLTKLFGGIENLARLPDLLLIIDPEIKNNKTAIREANRVKIPIAAVINSDANPDLITYPIPANASAPSSLNWIVERIEKAIEGLNNKS